MSSAKRRRIRETGALPGRKPGTRATRANSLATRSIALATSSAGISRSSSRRQVASAMEKSFLQVFTDGEKSLRVRWWSRGKRLEKGQPVRKQRATRYWSIWEGTGGVKFGGRLRESR